MSTVTVACKVPGGVVLGDGVVAAGPRLGPPVVGQPAPNYPGGYALTRDVPTEVWRGWLARNPDSDAVRNHLVFADELHAVAEARARGLARTRSGFEQARVKS